MKYYIIPWAAIIVGVIGMTWGAVQLYKEFMIFSGG